MDGCVYTADQTQIHVRAMLLSDEHVQRCVRTLFENTRIRVRSHVELKFKYFITYTCMVHVYYGTHS